MQTVTPHIVRSALREEAARLRRLAQHGADDDASPYEVADYLEQRAAQHAALDAASTHASHASRDLGAVSATDPCHAARPRIGSGRASSAIERGSG